MTAAFVSQKEFADEIGKDKSYVTRLKQSGRLVFNDAGLVDVEASKARIAETAGGRDDVAARHAAAKGEEPPKQNETRISAQARKEQAQADIAEMERDKLRGSLIERELVDQALADVVAFARQGLEQQAMRVSVQFPEVQERLYAVLVQDKIDMMGDMHKEAGKRLAELTKEGA